MDESEANARALIGVALIVAGVIVLACIGVAAVVVGAVVALW